MKLYTTKNGNKSDNRIENLELQTRQKHAREHRSTGVKTEVLTCSYCGEQFTKELNIVKYKRKHNQTNFYCSRHCQITAQWLDRKNRGLV